MKKLFLVIIFFLFNIYTIQALNIDSDKAILYNIDENKIIYEKNKDDKTSIASLTKIVTAITVIDNVDDLNKEVKISKNMLSGLDGYAKMGLKKGDKVSLNDLLYALMLPSGADAAQALAIYVSGSVDEFSTLMNEEVKKIGVKNSLFDNPIGMDSNYNYSTASDMASILLYSLSNNTFKEIFESNYYYIKSIDKTAKKTLLNYNIDTSIIKGSKTGFTSDAGLCLASTAYINGVNYLLITLNATVNTDNHIKDTLALYDYFSKNYSNKKIIYKNEILYSLKIKHGKKKSYDIFVSDDIEKYLENNIEKEDLIYEYDGISQITKDIKKNDKLGVINVIYDNEIIYSLDVYLEEDLEYHNYLLYFCIIGLVIVIIILLLKLIKSVNKNKILNR